MQIVTSMVSGLTMGGTILIAQYFGAKLEKDTKETISTMLTMFAAAGVGFTAVMFLCAPWVLSLLQTPPEAFEQALSYVRIASCRHPVYLWLQRHQRHAAGARGL